MNHLKYTPAFITSYATGFMAGNGISGWYWPLLATIIFFVAAAVHDSNASDVPPEERSYD